MEENLQLHRQEAAMALKVLEQHVLWKPGKAVGHLEKRKRMGHLAANVSLEEYNGLIQALLRERSNQVYLYRFDSERYYAIRGRERDVEWLIIVTRAGIIETAFPPDAIEEYLYRRGFVAIGTIREVAV